jgi:hypothetical protein
VLTLNAQGGSDDAYAYGICRLEKTDLRKIASQKTPFSKPLSRNPYMQ